MSEALAFHAVRAPIHGDLLGGPWSFSVARGSFMAVEAAPSVADTVTHLCAGIESPTEGRVEVLGQAPASLPRFQRYALLRRMGVAFQREGLVSNLTLEANLVVPLVFGSGYEPGTARLAAAEAMAELGLEAHRHRRPGALTREARVLSAMARAALRRPELLVLEHLTAALPDALATRALAWCRARSETMLVLVPGPNPALDRVTDGWLPPLAGRGEERTSS
jgi:ABC-type lipoprotein export system ATPase subunit